MGNGMELQTIKKHLKTPKAPLIALASQYTFMPLVSFVRFTSSGLLSGWDWVIDLLFISMFNNANMYSCAANRIDLPVGREKLNPLLFLFLYE